MPRDINLKEIILQLLFKYRWDSIVHWKQDWKFETTQIMGSFTIKLPENIGASTSNTSARRWVWSGRILRDRGLERIFQAFSSIFQAIFSASSFIIKYKWQVWRVEFIYESQISCNKSLIGSILSLSIGFNEKRLVRACKCFFLIYIMIWKLNKESSSWGLRLYWQGRVCTHSIFLNIHSYFGMIVIIWTCFA